MTREEALNELVRRADDNNLFVDDMTRGITKTTRPWMLTQDIDKGKLQEIRDALGYGSIPQKSYIVQTGVLTFDNDDFEPVARDLLPYLMKGKEGARRRYGHLVTALNVCRLLRKTG